MVTVQLDDPDHLAADEPVLLILEIRNSSDQAIRIDPISLQSSSMELELTRPSGARESVRSGLGPYLRNEAGVEIPSGGSVRYHEAFLPDEPGAWTASVSLRLTPQDLERKSTVVRLPSVRFQAGPQAPAVTQAVRSDHFDRLLLGQEKFLTETDGPKLERLEAAAS